MQVLLIKVIPGAKHNKVEPITTDSFKVYVTAPAQKGKANKNMLKLLARHLGITPAHLLITKGDRSNDKTVLVLEEEKV